MKILKNKTYESLVAAVDMNRVYSNTINNLNNQMDSKNAIIRQQVEFEKESILDVRKRMVIYGRRGSGKTSLLKHMLKSMSNYYLVDLLNEYDGVLHKNKYSLKANSSNQIFPDKEFDKFTSILSDKINEKKTILIDNSDVLFMNYEQSNILAYMLCQKDVSFIIISQNIDAAPRLIKGAMKQLVVCKSDNDTKFIDSAQSAKIKPFIQNISVVEFLPAEIAKII